MGLFKSNLIFFLQISFSGTGSDVSGVRTKAVKNKSGDYVINGQKMW